MQRGEGRGVSHPSQGPNGPLWSCQSPLPESARLPLRDQRGHGLRTERGMVGGGNRNQDFCDDAPPPPPAPSHCPPCPPAPSTPHLSKAQCSRQTTQGRGNRHGADAGYVYKGHRDKIPLPAQRTTAEAGTRERRDRRGREREESGSWRLDE